MSKYFYLLTLTALIAIGCDSSKNGKAPRIESKVKGQNEEIFGYNIDGINGNGKRCSTGEKRFSTLHLMCINIQDPIQNNDCAEEARLKKFTKVCQTKGYTYFDSLTCRFTLLDKDAAINAWTLEYDPKFKLKSFSVCAGHTSGGLIWSGMNIGQVRVHEGVYANVSINYYSKAETNSDHFSHFRLELYSRSGPMLDTPLEYSSGESTIIGQTKDQSFKYALKCERTWACDAKIGD